MPCFPNTPVQNIRSNYPVNSHLILVCWLVVTVGWLSQDLGGGLRLED